MGSLGTTKITYTRSKFFNQDVFNKLPKKLQAENIIDIGKERHGSDGIRYDATIQYEDGFTRSISEYGWADFKDYLEEALKNRNAQR